MGAQQKFQALTEAMRPQDPSGDVSDLRFKTGEHGATIQTICHK
jgi:hypothetical protein